ncbi:MAG: peptidylprolyl isomerase [Vicinamibacterales bacterium]
MSKRSVQKRIRAKRERERAQRKRSQKMRKLRAWATVATVAALAVLLFLVFRANGKDVKPTAKPSISNTPSTGAGAACGGAPRGAYTGKQYKAAPPMKIDVKKTYTAVLKTSCGDITIALSPKTAPKTVNNFVFLAQQKFYDNTLFHRVIPDFMMQGGDPQGTGSGGPGYKFADETKPTDRMDKAGILAMANSGPNTNGSQFFITHKPATHLSGKHTIFGTVTKGLNVVDKIVKLPRDERDKPNQDVVLYSVTITVK